MVAVGLTAAFLWRHWTHARWRWFWIGAGLWTVSVAGKVAWSVAANPVLYQSIQQLYPESTVPIIFAVYVGLVSAVTEIGLTAVCAYGWHSMTIDSRRAAGVGVGAGAIEAVLLGFASLAAVCMVLFDLPGSAPVAAEFEAATKTTSLPWLCGPVERTLAVILHTASRMLVLKAVAERRWLPFSLGFLLFTLVDSIAGYAAISGLLKTISLWWLELALVPTALLGLVAIRYCIRTWPSSQTEASDTSRSGPA